MRKLLLVILATCMVLVANSQNYRFFNDDFTVFMGGDNFIFPYKTLSKSIDDTKITFTFQGMVNHIDEMYFDVNGPGFLGQNAIWDIADQKYTLFNRFGDSIFLYTNKLIDSQWVAYEKNNDTVYARITTVDTALLETGVVDTIKTIVFVYPNNNTGFSESVHEKTFIISREKGLLNFFNIVVFPAIIDNYMIPIDYYNYSNASMLVDNFDPDVVDSISNSDIFNLNIGDELHTKRHGWTGSMPNVYSTDSWGIKRVLNRIDSSDNITIQYHHKYKAWEGDSVINQGIDTIIETYTKDKLSVLPAYRYEGNDDYAIIGGLTIIQGRIAVINSFIDLVKEGDQWTFMIYKSKDLYGSNAICGLGGWYYNYSDAIFDYYHKLEYYNVSGEEWGSPLTFTVGINDVDKIRIKVYPNPVKDHLIINSSDLKISAQLIVFDLSGKVMINRKLPRNDFQTKIDVSDFNAGLYTIRIINGHQVLTSKFLKVN
jgi:hypothetical protein